MREIPLTKGKVALIDDEDYFWVSKHKWHYGEKRAGSKIGYAKRGRKVSGKQLFVKMHRAIVACPDGFQVDHIDGNSLNNQKSNLRICTGTQNARNVTSVAGCGFKGVSKVSYLTKFRAKICHNGNRVHLGYFVTAIEAAIAYDAAAISRFGEFAKTNKAMGLL